MPTVEERLAYLEGKVEEHSRGFDEIRGLIVHTDGHVLAVDRKVDLFRTELGSRVDAIDQKVDRFRRELATRIAGLDQKVDRFREDLASRIHGLDGRIDSLDLKVDRFRFELASGIQSLDRNVSRQFSWLVGIQVALLLAVIGTLLR